MDWKKFGRWEFRVEDVIVVEHGHDLALDPDKRKIKLTIGLQGGHSVDLSGEDAEQFLAARDELGKQEPQAKVGRRRINDGPIS